MAAWQRFGAVDVHYLVQGGAWAALVVANDRRFTTIVDEYVIHCGQTDEIHRYEPGRFFERELVPIVDVLGQADPVDLLLVDGYVDLDPSGRPGLGAHVHRRLGLAVIGIAKTEFRTATHAAQVLRGSARRPLYVTAAGLALDEAARLVAEMAGPYRLPDAVRRADALARGADTPTRHA
jgi:deoxyribonuclease V